MADEAERARALIGAMDKRISMQEDNPAKAGMQTLRGELQAWIDRGGSAPELGELERRALALFNEFDRARFFGTRRIVRTDLPSPERTEEVVAYSEADRASGERALYGMLRSESREEAWLYVEYGDRGRTRQAWYEIGLEETEETAKTSLTDIMAILAEIGPENITSVSHYHIHPTGIERRATVSNKDLSSFVFLSENISHRFPSLAGKMDMRVVNEEGIYSLRGYDLPRFQGFASRIATDEDAMMRWFGLPFRRGEEFVSACRELGLDASFASREPPAQRRATR